LSQLKPDDRISIDLNLDEFDLTASEAEATYNEIKNYVLNKYNLNVSSLYIAQVKEKMGIKERQNYNISMKVDAKVPMCPPAKEEVIIKALRHFKMI
jgi:23S rRNA (uracil1939-C5)-methyltransferase